MGTKPKPLAEGKTIQVQPEYNVGWFYGEERFGNRQRFIGIGSSFRNSPSDGVWLTFPEARKLRDTLNRILEGS